MVQASSLVPLIKALSQHNLTYEVFTIFTHTEALGSICQGEAPASTYCGLFFTFY